MSSQLNLNVYPLEQWLGVETQRLPLNAYQWLGLIELESDKEKIRAAISRQRDRILTHKNSADVETWEQINRSLEEAIATVLDPGRKQELDASLRKNPAVTTTETLTSPLAGDKGRSLVHCRDCNSTNAATRRFCGECGHSLYDSCPQCSSEVAFAERFCGACGTNVESKRREQVEELQRQMEEARQLQNDHLFDEAAGKLQIVASINDAKYASLSRRANELLVEFAREKLEIWNSAWEQFEVARRYFDHHSYEKACKTVESIPERLRSRDMTELLQTAMARRDEMLCLRQDIRQALDRGDKGEALVKLERLLILKPNYAEGEQLAKQLCHGICMAARKQLRDHQYRKALTLLQTLPSFVRDNDVEKLIDKASELASLYAHLQSAPFADDATLALADRLHKLSPNTPGIEKQLAALKRLRSAKAIDARHAFPSCGNVSRESTFGASVEWLGHFTNCDVASPEVAAVLRAHPGEFFAAFGLALQGRGEAPIDINLLPTAKARFLENLSRPFFKAAKGAWGIDLGSTGLRAVRLGPKGQDGRIRVENAVYIAHSQSATHAEDEMAASEIISRTLASFREKYPFAKDKEKRDTVMISVPGHRSIGRFFDLPPTPPTKLDELIRYEAKHQIPIPIDDLGWGCKIVPGADGKAADKLPRHVMLLAARVTHVRERVALFNRADIPVDGVAAESVALHNALHHEFFRDIGHSDSLAVLEIGVKGTNLVVTSRDGMWCHSAGVNGDDFTTALVRQFQLTTPAAEALKRNIYKARRYYLVEDAFQPVFVRYRSEIERSLESFTKQFPGRKIERIFITGGGAATPGLLRYLTHGE